MFRSLLGAFAVAAICVTGAASAADGDYQEKGAFYIAPIGQYYRFEGDRQVDHAWGYDVAAGYDFAKDWAAEFNFDSVGTNRRVAFPQGPGLQIRAYTLDVLYKFPLDFSPVKPFLMAGVGGVDENVPSLSTKKTAGAEVGGGVLVALGPQHHFFRTQLRVQAKYRHEWIDTTYDGIKDPSDVIFGVGIQAMFGGHVPPAPAPKEVVVAPPPDSDGDGVTDDIDACPNTPAGAKVDARGCEFDEDGDGVVDRLDECPNTPKGWPVDAKGCPLDTDGDGVADGIDKCPDTPKGDKVDSVGCTIKDEIKLQGVNFATGSAEIVGDSSFVLNYAVDTLKKYPNVVIEVRGHTDSTGSRALNMRLSQKRAESVMAYLQEHGATNKMTAKGYGPDHPIADNKTPDGRLENRRVVLRIVSGL
jgi:OOP family OmpA-OmpF porin